MLIVVSLVLLALGLLSYRRQLGPGGSAGLFILRLLVLLVLAGIVGGAILSRSWSVRPRRAAMLADRSGSMALFGLDTAAAAEAERFPLPAGVARDRWVFADSAKPTRNWSVDGINSVRTRLGRALELVGRTRPGAVVLLSDGQENGDVQPVRAAAGLGVPVYTVGFGPARRRDAAVTRLTLPAVVHAGDSVEVAVRIMASGFASERAMVRLGPDSREVALSEEVVEQELVFRTIFSRPGRQVVRATIDSLKGESDFANNVRTTIADVRPSRYRVVYITNRPGPNARFILQALAADPRISTMQVVAQAGNLPRSLSGAAEVDVFLIDGVAERPDDAGLWQGIAARVRAGAGMMLLAGPDYAPGAVLGAVLPVEPTRSRPGGYTPELSPDGRVLPWFGSPSGEGDGAVGNAVDVSRLPPFSSARPVRADVPGVSTWLLSREDGVGLMTASRSGKGKLVYVAGYPLWRWGFVPTGAGREETPLGLVLGGIVRYLAESDTNRFALESDKPGFLHGEQARLHLRAVALDGTPWNGLNVMLNVKMDTAAGGRAAPAAVPMTEQGNGTYEALLDALSPGEYRAEAVIRLADSVIGRAKTDFVVAEQDVELARTGLNQALLRAVAEASGGSYFPAESLPGAGFEIAMGGYERRFVFDPRRTTLAYLMVALLAGLEWFLRRRRGLL